MQLFYQNIPVNNGDCHFIRLIDGKDQYVIMVDCGSFNDSVQAYIESKCRKHIDILVVTHIDDDSILPELRLFREDAEGRKWINMGASLTNNVNHEGDSLNSFVFYNCFLVRDEDVEMFCKWAKKQSFGGRWMPEQTGKQNSCGTNIHGHHLSKIVYILKKLGILLMIVHALSIMPL